MNDKACKALDILASEIEYAEFGEKVEMLNEVRKVLSVFSPFNSHPVDCVQWVKIETVQANDYNPNVVAPPEMLLLETSIDEDGYTQPVVTWEVEDGRREVVDGFHRHLVAEKKRTQLHGYLPVVTINPERIDKGDRIASTIRHNRARGKHVVNGMVDIVVDLKRRNWSDKKIGKELGMDPDEVLRLSQISGLAELFKGEEFSEAWEATSIFHDEQLESISDVER